MSLETYVLFLNDFNGFGIRFVKIINLIYLQRGVGLTTHYLYKNWKYPWFWKKHQMAAIDVLQMALIQISNYDRWKVQK